MLLQKTEKARKELSPGVRTLSQRERTLLLLSEGKTLTELRAMFDGAGAIMAEKLMAEGYLAPVNAADIAPVSPGGPDGPSSPVATAAKEAPPTPAAQPSATPAAPALAPTAPEAGAAAKPKPPAEGSAELLKSLAGARMYLFDMSERMFARRDPALAKTFNEALRNARDRESMLQVSEQMLEEITKIAGQERADAVDERLQQFLPHTRKASKS